MRAYEAGKPAYFATPPVNLVYAFHASLSRITGGTPTLAERFRLHREASRRVKEAAEGMGFKQVAKGGVAANGMTAVSATLLVIRKKTLTRGVVGLAIFPSRFECSRSVA